MKLLVIGSGAREHALVWKLSESPMVNKIYCAPGNAGIGSLAECVDIKAEDIEGLLNFALMQKIDLTVVGPEVPLVAGIADAFEEKGLRIFGPGKAAARLEGSKAYAKEFMQSYEIPTAKYGAYKDFDKAVAALHTYGLPVVIKADGLAAGKGVIIAHSRQEAAEAIESIMGSKKFGEAGSTIVIEEFLKGREVSVLAFVDGNTAIPMVSAQDYKRALDGDLGPNTGGMGAVSPAFAYSESDEEIVRREIIDKTLYGMKQEGIIYKGVLYFGLMLTDDGPKVLEYNTRFGDPETEVILPRLQTDLLHIMNSVIDGKLEKAEIRWSDDRAVCVVLASGGYPEKYDTNYEITGVQAAAEDAMVFHAGTKNSEVKLVTAGGRVLVLSAVGEDYDKARDKAYAAAAKVNFRNVHYRKDIGIK
ncbi:MAG: phosphoribosylamine--glycine ligase [Clostridia bacterium]|jgi:phosphoribosylamine--glycine ligase|nr:phosphoribosylamine--glycine ligase [Clostridia bacterium]